MKTYEAEWQLVDEQLSLYKYYEVGAIGQESKPVLFLHSTLSSYLSWGQMAHYFARAGVEDIYGINIPEIQNDDINLDNAMQQLRETVLMLSQFHPRSDDIVLIGVGVGGVLAYYYWQEWGDKALISFLFMLGSPHAGTRFPNLVEKSIQSIEREQNVDTQQRTNPVDFSRIVSTFNQSETIVVNILGNAVGVDFDGVVQGLKLPEAVNVTMPEEHQHLNKSQEVANYIIECLRGERYVLRLKLVGLQMRREDAPRFSGPITFDIDGAQMPPDTVFEPETDKLYLFEEGVPPLCTLSYPVRSVSATITIHMRDLSATEGKGRRRRMYMRLFTPLMADYSVAHTMQDSEGSDFLWRVVCDKMPTVLGPSWYDRTSPVIKGV